MVTRRVLIKRLAGLPLVGSLFGLEIFARSPPPAYAPTAGLFQRAGSTDLYKCGRDLYIHDGMSHAT